MTYRNSEIKIFDNIQKLSQELASEFISEINSRLKSKEKVKVALSGGNSPKIFFQNLILNKEKLNWEKILLFWGDERCVPHNDPESNFGMTKFYLLDHIDIPEDNIKRIKCEENPEEEAKRYSNVIKSNLPEVNSLPSFDIIILGLGEDGHIASIFPNQMKLLNTENICATAYHPVTKQTRITLTGRVINNSQKIFFLVSGKNKSIVVSQILMKQEDFLKYPAYYIKPLDSEAVWFLDKDAASDLIKKGYLEN